MTRTAYSCPHLKTTPKHGCSVSLRCFCAADQNKFVEPMNCYKNCEIFAGLFPSPGRPARKILIEVELL